MCRRVSVSSSATQSERRHTSAHYLQALSAGGSASSIHVADGRDACSRAAGLVNGSIPSIIGPDDDRANELLAWEPAAADFWPETIRGTLLSAARHIPVESHSRGGTRGASAARGGESSHSLCLSQSVDPRVRKSSGLFLHSSESTASEMDLNEK